MTIEFLPLVDLFWAWIFLILVALAGFGYSFLYANHGVSKARILTKSLLFFGFWIFLALVILNPQVESEGKIEPLIVYQQGLSPEEISFWKDSLKVKQAIEISDYQDESSKVFLLGEDFSAEQLYPFQTKEIQWVTPRKHGVVDQISWKGAVRKGENQRIYFSIFSSQPSAWLKVLIPNTDSVELSPGWNQGMLEFQSNGLGRAEVPLALGNDTLGLIRYFIEPALPKKYLIQVGFPSAETRTFVNWLREKGETVSEEVQLSKETVIASNAEKDSVQVLIIDPAQLNKRNIQDWVKDGKGNLLIFQVDDTQEVVNLVNRIFQTEFEVEQASEELNLGLLALPFRWISKSNQISLIEDRIAVQQVGNSQIGISLLELSYSLIFQGNNSAYERIWGEVLGAMEPDESSAIRFAAPVFEGFSSEFEIVQSDSVPEIWLADLDTISLSKDLINPLLSKGIYAPSREGWIDCGANFSIYSYGNHEFPTAQTAKRLSEFSSRNQKSETELSHPISPWVGLLGMMIFLAGMWLEPKVSF